MGFDLVKINFGQIGNSQIGYGSRVSIVPMKGKGFSRSHALNEIWVIYKSNFGSDDCCVGGYMHLQGRATL